MNHQGSAAIIFVVLIVLFGIGLGYLYSSLPKHHPQDSQEACESVGGDWQQDACLLSYKEAVEQCTDSGQCISGVCYPPELSDEQLDILDKKPLTNISGTCYAGEPNGCVPQVIKGAVTRESMCLSK